VAQFIGKEKTNTVKSLGTVPTAVNVNFDQFWDNATRPASPARTPGRRARRAGGQRRRTKEGVITFCNTGHLASIAWFGLSEVAGLKGVRLYDGSMAEWTADPSREVVAN
jgi:thiosulfate/3-mercaptopyruvate sulfurtransferase